MKKHKNALILALALAGSTSAGSQAVEPIQQKGESRASAGKGDDRGIKSEIDRSVIIESLKAVKKDPTTVKFSSAMCYDMSMPPADITFTCPACGTQNTFAYQSYPGKVAEMVSYLQRALPDAKVKIEADFSDFCSKCCKDPQKEPELKFNTHCLDCGVVFPWKASTIEELEQLDLLFISFPITEVNQGQIGSVKIAPEKLSEYLSQRYLCPGCRERHGLK